MVPGVAHPPPGCHPGQRARVVRGHALPALPVSSRPCRVRRAYPPAVGWKPDRDTLRGRVAVVAGATRGAGRGIAAALGEAGATVVCTGRTSRSSRGGSDYDRPETIEETADLVTELGGAGVAVQ